MTTKKNRKTYTNEFKGGILKLDELVDVAGAARQLKLYETQIYNWRSNTSEKNYRVWLLQTSRKMKTSPLMDVVQCATYLVVDNHHIRLNKVYRNARVLAET